MPYRSLLAACTRWLPASSRRSARARASSAADERRHGVHVDVGAGMQAHHPERAAPRRRQVPVRPGEHGVDVRVRIVLGGQQVQPPAVVGQLRHHRGQRRRRPPVHQLRGDPQGERQPGAVRHQRGRRPRRRRPRRRRARRRSRARASSRRRTSRSSRRAPCRTTRPDRLSRLVTSTTLPADPGSSGRTWSTDAALSSRISMRRPCSMLRYRAARSSASAGTCSPGSPSERRNRARASLGAIGCSGS